MANKFLRFNGEPIELNVLVENVEGLTKAIADGVAEVEVDLSEYSTTDEVKAMIDVINSFNVEIVATLPIDDVDKHTIYFLPKDDGVGYDEYMYINSEWELIGSTTIDLSNYYTKDVIENKFNDVNDKIDEVETKVDDVTTKLDDVENKLDDVVNSVENESYKNILVEELPTTDIDLKALYFVPRVGGSGYDSFVYIDEEWIKASSSDGSEGSFELPIATANELGGIKVGDGLSIESNGTLSVDSSELPTIDQFNALLERLEKLESTTKGEDKNFVFTQDISSQTWTINHNLDKLPSVTVVDVDGNVIYCDITIVDENNVVLTFAENVAGKAYIN